MEIKVLDTKTYKTSENVVARYDMNAYISKRYIDKDRSSEDCYLNEDKSECTYTVQLDYPFSVIAEAEVKAKTLYDLVNGIFDMYHQIYKEENESSNIKEDYIPGMYNRVETNGKYGIWGHVIGDLVIEEIQLHDNNFVTTYVGS